MLKLQIVNQLGFKGNSLYYSRLSYDKFKKVINCAQNKSVFAINSVWGGRILLQVVYPITN